jgi:RNA polymerase sigma-70 factor (ECF subfamily)
MSLVSFINGRNNKDIDAQLMLNYARGENDAFEQLYVKYKDELFRFFLRQCGNQALAEELYQDVWVRIIDARQRYEPKAKFRTWLYHIAHNILIDHYRKPTEEEQPEIDEVPSARPDNPEAIISGQEKLDRYRAMIRTLPDEQREVFLLKEESGMSLQDITQITGDNFETVKSRLRYAVNKLKQALEEPESHDGRQRTQAVK